MSLLAGLSMTLDYNCRLPLILIDFFCYLRFGLINKRSCSCGKPFKFFTEKNLKGFWGVYKDFYREVNCYSTNSFLQNTDPGIKFSSSDSVWLGLLAHLPAFVVNP